MHAGEILDDALIGVLHLDKRESVAVLYHQNITLISTSRNLTPFRTPGDLMLVRVVTDDALLSYLSQLGQLVALLRPNMLPKYQCQVDM